MIAAANPGLSAGSLPLRREIKIPPLPPAAMTPRRAGPADAGRLIEDADGQRIYIVKKGDAGFWGIAKALYGHGKYWPAIAKANPRADSGGLKPGDRLIIPPKPQPTRPTGSTPPTVRRGAIPPGMSVYVVKAGDQGWWGVAKNVYGSGALWPAIEKANPGVDPTRLQANQEILYPPKEEAARLIRATGPSRTATRTRPTRPRPEEPERDLRPVFD